MKESRMEQGSSPENIVSSILPEYRESLRIAKEMALQKLEGLKGRSVVVKRTDHHEIRFIVSEVLPVSESIGVLGLCYLAGRLIGEEGREVEIEIFEDSEVEVIQ